MYNPVKLTEFKKQDDPASRLLELLSKFEKDFQRRFIELANGIRNQADLNAIADLLEAGNVREATSTLERALARYSDVVVSGIVLSGQNTAQAIEELLRVFVSFDQTNTRAVRMMQQSRLRLVSALTQSQRDAVRESLVDGIRRGINPVQQAREVLRSVGLTAYQVRAVNNFRRLLESGSSLALRRELRDRRFDPTILRAIRGEALSDTQINRIVDAYARRQLAFRAETIARTEALRAVHQGNNLMYNQAIEEGLLDPTRLISTWITAEDENVRDSHDGMHGQERQFGIPFMSDAGNELRYPGDENAPGDETIQCRCTTTTRLLPSGEA